jgi:methylated-DNA-[protein]-cysteine S-methyltransferase
VAGATTWRQPTPFGDVEVVLGPNGIRRLSLPIEDRPSWDHVAFATTPERRVRNARSRAGRVAQQLDDYFAGRRTRLDGDVDLGATALSDLQRRILLTVRAEVPYGETATYGEVAELVGRPGAARAVGTAMARNPVPLFVPCHRVVAANGIGGYGGGAAGVALKRALLDLESRARPNA